MWYQSKTFSSFFCEYGAERAVHQNGSNLYINPHSIRRILYDHLKMTSGSISHRSSSASVTNSNILANHSVSSIINLSKPEPTRRQVHSAPAALGSTPTHQEPTCSSSSSISDSSSLDLPFQKPVVPMPATTSTIEESKPKTKSKFDWTYKNTYTTRSPYGKAIVGTASGVPSGCTIM